MKKKPICAVIQDSRMEEERRELKEARNIHNKWLKTTVDMVYITITEMNLELSASWAIANSAIDSVRATVTFTP